MDRGDSRTGRTRHLPGTPTIERPRTPAPDRAVPAPRGGATRVELGARVAHLTRLLEQEPPETSALDGPRFAVILATGERAMARALGQPGAPILDNRETRQVWTAQLARLAPSVRDYPDELARRLITVLPRILKIKDRPDLTDDTRIHFGFDLALRQVAQDLRLHPPASPAPPQVDVPAHAKEPKHTPEPVRPLESLQQGIDLARAEQIRDRYRGLAEERPRLLVDRLTEHHVQAILSQGHAAARKGAGQSGPDYSQPEAQGAFSQGLERADRTLRQADLGPILDRYQVEAAQAVFTAYLASLEPTLPSSRLPAVLTDRGPERPYNDGLVPPTKAQMEDWRRKDQDWRERWRAARDQAPAAPPERQTYLAERTAALTAPGPRGERGMEEIAARARAEAEFLHARGVERQVFQSQQHGNTPLPGDHPRLREAFAQGLEQAQRLLAPVRPEEIRPAVLTVLTAASEARLEAAQAAYKQARLDTHGEGHTGQSRSHVDAARGHVAAQQAAIARLEDRADAVRTILHDHGARFHALVAEHGPQRGVPTFIQEVRDSLPAGLQEALVLDSRKVLTPVEQQQRRARGEETRYLPGPLIEDLTILAREGRQILTRLGTYQAMERSLERAAVRADLQAILDTAAGRGRDQAPLTLGVLAAPAAMEAGPTNRRLSLTCARRPNTRVLTAGGEAARRVHQHALDLSERGPSLDPAFLSQTWTDRPGAREGRRTPEEALLGALRAAAATGQETVLVLLHRGDDPHLLAIGIEAKEAGIRVTHLRETEPTPPLVRTPAPPDPLLFETRLAMARAAGVADRTMAAAAAMIPIWRELHQREARPFAPPATPNPDFHARLDRLGRELRGQQIATLQSFGTQAREIAALAVPVNPGDRADLQTSVGRLRTHYLALAPLPDLSRLTPDQQAATRRKYQIAKAVNGADQLPTAAVEAIVRYASWADRTTASTREAIGEAGRIGAERKTAQRAYARDLASELKAILTRGPSAPPQTRERLRALTTYAFARDGAPYPYQAVNETIAYAQGAGSAGDRLRGIAHEGANHLDALRVSHQRAARGVTTSIDHLRQAPTGTGTALGRDLDLIRHYYERLQQTGAGGRFPKEAVDRFAALTNQTARLTQALQTNAQGLDLLAFSRETHALAATGLGDLTQARAQGDAERAERYKAARLARAEATAEATQAGIGAPTARLLGEAAALRVTTLEARPLDLYHRFVALIDQAREQTEMLTTRLHEGQQIVGPTREVPGDATSPRLAQITRDLDALARLQLAIQQHDHIDIAGHDRLQNRHLAEAVRAAALAMIEVRAASHGELIVQLWGKQALIELALDPDRAHDQGERAFYQDARSLATRALEKQVTTLSTVITAIARGDLTPAGGAEQLREEGWIRQDPTQFPSEIGAEKTLRSLLSPTQGGETLTALAEHPATLPNLADLLNTIRTPLWERKDPELGDMNSQDKIARAFREQTRAEQQEHTDFAARGLGYEDQVQEMLSDFLGPPVAPR